MPFHALAFADGRGSCLKPEAAKPRVQTASKSSANINALKQACLIIILAFSHLLKDASCQ